MSEEGFQGGMGVLGASGTNTPHARARVGLAGVTCGSKSGPKCFFPILFLDPIFGELKQMVLDCFHSFSAHISPCKFPKSVKGGKKWPKLGHGGEWGGHVSRASEVSEEGTAGRWEGVGGGGHVSQASEVSEQGFRGRGGGGIGG